MKKILLLFAIAAIFSCAKDDATSPTAAEITAFSFQGITPAVEGKITGTDINFTVPEGTDLTKLVATFSYAAASVKVNGTEQISGTTPNDFTSPVNYVVTSQDGTVTKNYIVTVIKQTQTSKEIISFYFKDFPENTGLIEGTNITVTLPDEKDVTKLVANFIHNGVSVKVGETEQKSGETVNDFTSPVNYVVTDLKGNTKIYKIIVISLKPSSKEIIEFSLPELYYPDITISQEKHTISVSAKTGSTLTGLKAIFTTTGTSVKVGTTEQASGETANDFGSAVTYTVTAKDGSKQDYVVTVTTSADKKYVTIPDANFLAFLKTSEGVPNAFDDSANPDKLNIYHADVIGMDAIECEELSIADLTGIEYFVGLTLLHCDRNNLNSLDVSKNTALINFYCDNNHLNSLIIGKNTAMRTIYCDSNLLVALDVSQNTNLIQIRCDSNQLKSLDVSKNTVLEGLSCYNNQLTYLDASTRKNWGYGLAIYSDPPVSGENPITTLKVNVSQENSTEVKKVKTNNVGCIISTYTTSSVENDLQCTNYDPRDGQEKCLD